MKKSNNICFLALFLLVCNPVIGTEETSTPVTEGEPLWEIGIFGGAILMPHYRGSDNSKFYVVPFPFVIYRGERLELEREGARGIFWKRSWGELNFSINGNPPVTDDDAREGMPDLDPLVEVGPAFRLYFLNEVLGTRLYLRTAVRAVFSLDTKDFGPSYAGLRGGPSIVLSDYKPTADSPWKFGGSLGIDFADDKYNSYFYNVTDEQVIAGRNTYSSRGGYGGISLSGHASRRISRTLQWGLYARWDNVSLTVYEDSPLVRQKDNFLIGTALIWTFAESKTLVKK